MPCCRRVKDIQNFQLIVQIIKMNHYLCYYLDDKSDASQCIIKHLTSFYTQECLKYCELELIEVTGSASYRTKVYCNIVPAAGDSAVGACNKVGILRKDRPKKQNKN